MSSDNFSYFYEYGVIEVYIVEGEHVSIEFFPSSQSKESFESGEFDNTFRITTILNNIDTRYDWSIPREITEEEMHEFREVLVAFLKEYLADSKEDC